MPNMEAENENVSVIKQRMYEAVANENTEALMTLSGELNTALRARDLARELDALPAAFRVTPPGIDHIYEYACVSGDDAPVWFAGPEGAISTYRSYMKRGEKVLRRTVGKPALIAGIA